jgi:hypothetical protein
MSFIFFSIAFWHRLIPGGVFIKKKTVFPAGIADYRSFPDVLIPPDLILQIVPEGLYCSIGAVYGAEERSFFIYKRTPLSDIRQIQKSVDFRKADSGAFDKRELFL